MIIEAMAQTGGLLLLLEIPDREHKLLYFVAVDDARFRRPVVPGEQLLARRTTYFEVWAIDKVAAAIARQGRVLGWLRPRRTRSVFLAGDVLHRPHRPPVVLTDREKMPMPSTPKSNFEIWIWLVEFQRLWAARRTSFLANM